MNRKQQSDINQEVIKYIFEYPRLYEHHVPSYQLMITRLNHKGFRSSRGNLWTRRSLLRMLQREGYSGLHGLFSSDRKWNYDPNPPPVKRTAMSIFTDSFLASIK